MGDSEKGGLVNSVWFLYGLFVLFLCFVDLFTLYFFLFFFLAFSFTIILHLEIFFMSALTAVFFFHWNLRDSKYHSASRTFLSILTDYYYYYYYYQRYYYFTICKFFYTSFNWWLFTGVCVRRSLLRSPGLF